MELDSIKHELEEARKNNVELRESKAAIAQKLNSLESAYESCKSVRETAELKLDKIKEVNKAHQSKIDELVYYQSLKDDEIATQHETIRRMRNHSDTL